MTRFLIGLFAVAGCAFGVFAEAQTGGTVCWKNTGTGAALASTVEKPVHESNFSFRIPPSANLPAGTLVKITEVRLASVNPRFTTDSLKIGHYDATYKEFFLTSEKDRQRRVEERRRFLGLSTRRPSSSQGACRS